MNLHELQTKAISLFQLTEKSAVLYIVLCNSSRFARSNYIFLLSDNLNSRTIHPEKILFRNRSHYKKHIFLIHNSAIKAIWKKLKKSRNALVDTWISLYTEQKKKNSILPDYTVHTYWHAVTRAITISINTDRCSPPRESNSHWRQENSQQRSSASTR